MVIEQFNCFLTDRIEPQIENDLTTVVAVPHGDPTAQFLPDPLFMPFELFSFFELELPLELLNVVFK